MDKKKLLNKVQEELKKDDSPWLISGVIRRENSCYTYKKKNISITIIEMFNSKRFIVSIKGRYYEIFDSDELLDIINYKKEDIYE